MSEKDYYNILRIDKEADQKTIKEAYNKMLFTYHPDRVEEEEKEKFRNKIYKIQEAYETLSDHDKKQKYDQQFKHNHNDKCITNYISKNNETSNVNPESSHDNKLKNNGSEQEHEIYKELREAELRRIMGTDNNIEPKAGLLSDDEILKYVPESKAAQEIKLKNKSSSFKFFKKLGIKLGIICFIISIGVIFIGLMSQYGSGYFLIGFIGLFVAFILLAAGFFLK
jgi:curved DNA-binding protein CbpA